MLALTVLLAIPSTPIQSPPPQPSTPEAVVRALYDRVTWKPPQVPDWDSVRAVFHKEAVFSLRLGKGDIRVMNLDKFIQEWIDYAKLEPVVKNGFQEKIVRLKATEHGEIANVYVLYEAMIPGYMKAPEQGIDICHLVKTGGKWTIVSIVNDLVVKGKPLPPDLR